MKKKPRLCNIIPKIMNTSNDGGAITEPDGRVIINAWNVFTHGKVNTHAHWNPKVDGETLDIVKSEQ